jgi:hypothetical protein
MRDNSSYFVSFFLPEIKKIILVFVRFVSNLFYLASFRNERYREREKEREEEEQSWEEKDEGVTKMSVGTPEGKRSTEMFEMSCFEFQSFE